MHVVLVHGVGGTPTTWSEVVPLLTAAGRDVTAVTNPLRSLTGDVAHTTAAVDALGGPVLLVGHSYGGAVITNAGRSPRVTGLVYVAAFAPDEGETVNEIVERYPPAEVSQYMRRGPNGEWASEHTDRVLGGDRLGPHARAARDRGTPSPAAARTPSSPSRPAMPAWRDAAELVPGRRRGPDAAPRDPARHGGAHGRRHRPRCRAATSPRASRPASVVALIERAEALSREGAERAAGHPGPAGRVRRAGRAAARRSTAST